MRYSGGGGGELVKIKDTELHQTRQRGGPVHAQVCHVLCMHSYKLSKVNRPYMLESASKFGSKYFKYLKAI